MPLLNHWCCKSFAISTWDNSPASFVCTPLPCFMLTLTEHLHITMHLNYSQANQPSRLFKSPDWLNKSNPIWCFLMLISMQICAGRWKWQPGEFQVVKGVKIKIWFSSKWESNGSSWGSWTRPGLNFQHLKCTSDRRLITGAQDEVCDGLKGVVEGWRDIVELISSHKNLVTGDKHLTS